MSSNSGGSRSGRYVDVNGSSIFYHDHGEGSPLVLVHGGLGSSADWQPVVAELLDGLRIITPDSRGHGRSTNPSGQLSYAQIADDIAALIVALGLNQPVVGGWSDGGQATLELAVRHPGTAAALIVGGAYPDFVTSGLRETHRTLLCADEAGVPDLQRFDQELGSDADAIKAAHPGGARQWQSLIEQTAPMWLDYPGLTPTQVGTIDAPTLLIAGDRDEVIPLDLTTSLFRTLPNAELGICPHADHLGPMTPEQAGVFARIIGDFVHRHRA